MKTKQIQSISEHPGAISIEIPEKENDSGFCTINIIDNGPGIPDKFRDKIFDPLFTTRQIGTGLGLTSCKRIVEDHGGMISFQSRAGVGTIFTIKLPKMAQADNITYASRVITEIR